MKTSDSARGMLVNYYSNVYSDKSVCTDCRVIELEMVVNSLDCPNGSKSTK